MDIPGMGRWGSRTGWVRGGRLRCAISRSRFFWFSQRPDKEGPEGHEEHEEGQQQPIELLLTTDTTEATVTATAKAVNLPQGESPRRTQQSALRSSREARRRGQSHVGRVLPSPPWLPWFTRQLQLPCERGEAKRSLPAVSINQLPLQLQFFMPFRPFMLFLVSLFRHQPRAES